MGNPHDEPGGPGPLLALALTGLAALGGFYVANFVRRSPPKPATLRFQRAPEVEPDEPPPDDSQTAPSGLDLLQKDDLPSPGPRKKAAPAAASAPAIRSSGPTPGRASKTAEPAPGSLAQRIWSLRPRFEALNRKFMSRYPAVARYERDWMADPGLRKLRDEFMLGDHDPMNFIYGLAASKTFGAMVTRYSRQPGIQAFANEALRNIPVDILAMMNDRMTHDSVAANLAHKLSVSLGLPLAAGQVDPEAIMRSAMKNPPGAVPPDDRRRIPR